MEPALLKLKEKYLLGVVSAIEELGINPVKTLLIDDSESNLAAAEEFGLIPILIDRYDRQYLKSKYPIIRSLDNLFDFSLNPHSL